VNCFKSALWGWINLLDVGNIWCRGDGTRKLLWIGYDADDLVYCPFQFMIRQIANFPADQALINSHYQVGPYETIVP
jgi:hypothetical protein